MSSVALSAVVSGLSVALELIAAGHRITEAIQKSTDGVVPQELWDDLVLLQDMSKQRRDLAIQKAKNEEMEQPSG